MSNVRVFIDFWNFQLCWNDAHPFDKSKGEAPTKIDWKGLPIALMNELPSAMGAQKKDGHQFKGVNVYASVNPAAGSKDQGLKNFLSKTMNQMPGYQVYIFDRKERISEENGVKVIKTVEKGVDTRIVTDLFAGAINNTYDIALLVSNDSDFCPAISSIQERLDKHIIHVGFRRGGDEIRASCWSHMLLDGNVAETLKQS